MLMTTRHFRANPLGIDDDIKHQFEQVANKLILHCIGKHSVSHQDDRQNSTFYYQLMQLMEEPLLRLSLQANYNRVSHTATYLGMSRGTLRKKLTAYQIDHFKPFK